MTAYKVTLTWQVGSEYCSALYRCEAATWESAQEAAIAMWLGETKNHRSALVEVWVQVDLAALVERVRRQEARHGS